MWVWIPERSQGEGRCGGLPFVRAVNLLGVRPGRRRRIRSGGLVLLDRRAAVCSYSRVLGGVRHKGMLGRFHRFLELAG